MCVLFDFVFCRSGLSVQQQREKYDTGEGERFN
jgi:hypothetical protein